MYRSHLDWLGSELYGLETVCAKVFVVFLATQLVQAKLIESQQEAEELIPDLLAARVLGTDTQRKTIWAAEKNEENMGLSCFDVFCCSTLILSGCHTLQGTSGVHQPGLHHGSSRLALDIWNRDHISPEFKQLPALQAWIVRVFLWVVGGDCASVRPVFFFGICGCQGTKIERSS